LPVDGIGWGAECGMGVINLVIVNAQAGCRTFALCARGKAAEWVGSHFEN